MSDEVKAYKSKHTGKTIDEAVDLALNADKQFLQKSNPDATGIFKVKGSGNYTSISPLRIEAGAIGSMGTLIAEYDEDKKAIMLKTYNNSDIQLKGVAEPQIDSDAANKMYVDAEISGSAKLVSDKSLQRSDGYDTSIEWVGQTGNLIIEDKDGGLVSGPVLSIRHNGKQTYVASHGVFSVDQSNHPVGIRIDPNRKEILFLEDFVQSEDGIHIKGVHIPENDLDVANKKYVDDSVKAMDKKFLPIGGGSIDGEFKLTAGGGSSGIIINDDLLTFFSPYISLGNIDEGIYLYGRNNDSLLELIDGWFQLHFAGAGTIQSDGASLAVVREDNTFDEISNGISFYEYVADNREFQRVGIYPDGLSCLKLGHGRSNPDEKFPTRLTNLDEPTEESDATNKKYVDTKVDVLKDEITKLKKALIDNGIAVE